MKTNHRRENKGKYLIGFDYGVLTSINLIKHGCSPNYQGRAGARSAIRGLKKKDERELRHQYDQALRQNPLEYEHDKIKFGKSKVFK